MTNQPKRGSGSFSLTKPEVAGVDERAKFHGFRNRGDYLRALVRTEIKLGAVRAVRDGADELLPTEAGWCSWPDQAWLEEQRRRNQVGRANYEAAVAAELAGGEPPPPRFHGVNEGGEGEDLPTAIAEAEAAKRDAAAAAARKAKRGGGAKRGGSGPGRGGKT